MSRGQTETRHDCRDHVVSIAVAAKAVGQPYQYVYGRAKRGRQPLWPSKNEDGTEGKMVTCLVCTTDFYGKAEENTAKELLAEPIQAYRAWTINDFGLLISWGGTFTWLPGGAEAKCDRRQHDVPTRRCTCGLYALKSIKAVQDYFGHSTGRRSDLVFGAVDLYGRYVDHDDGYRASQGKPTALLCNSWERAERIHLVAERYGIGVAHSNRSLEQTIWGRLEVIDFGDRRPEEGGRSYATGEARGGTRDRTAPCRAAARGASTLADMRYLYGEGMISISNILEVFEVPFETT